MPSVSDKTALNMLGELHRVKSLYDCYKSWQAAANGLSIHMRMLGWPQLMSSYRDLVEIIADCQVAGIDDAKIIEALSPTYTSPALGMPRDLRRAALRVRSAKW